MYCRLIYSDDILPSSFDELIDNVLLPVNDLHARNIEIVTAVITVRMTNSLSKHIQSPSDFTTTVFCHKQNFSSVYGQQEENADMCYMDVYKMDGEPVQSHCNVSEHSGGLSRENHCNDAIKRELSNNAGKSDSARHSDCAEQSHSVKLLYSAEQSENVAAQLESVEQDDVIKQGVTDVDSVKNSSSLLLLSLHEAGLSQSSYSGKLTDVSNSAQEIAVPDNQILSGYQIVTGVHIAPNNQILSDAQIVQDNQIIYLSCDENSIINYYGTDKSCSPMSPNVSSSGEINAWRLQHTSNHGDVCECCLGAQISSLFINNQLADVTLVADDVSYPVHRLDFCLMCSG